MHLETTHKKRIGVTELTSDKPGAVTCFDTEPSQCILNADFGVSAYKTDSYIQSFICVSNQLPRAILASHGQNFSEGCHVSHSVGSNS